MIDLLSPAQAAVALRAGKPIVYPTEGVYGLGCLPSQEDALTAVLTIKGRNQNKGFILIAANWAQLSPYVNFDALNAQQLVNLAGTWPGPVTWILPCTQSCSPLLRGQYHSVAVRISSHPVVQALCLAADSALISTSANISGQPPLRTLAECTALTWPVAGVVEGALGGQLGPTPIFDALTQQKVRSC
ncbi:MAG: Sua5/YciO/YrdC/YwlC family protein [Pseudomonadota bacterium]